MLGGLLYRPVAFVLRHATVGAFEWSRSLVGRIDSPITHAMAWAALLGIPLSVPALRDIGAWPAVILWLASMFGSIYDEHTKLRAALERVPVATPPARDLEAERAARFEGVRDLANTIQQHGYNQLTKFRDAPWMFEHNWPARAEVFLRELVPGKTAMWRAIRREEPDMKDVTTNIWQHRQRIHAQRKAELLLKRFGDVIADMKQSDVAMVGALDDARWHTGY